MSLTVEKCIEGWTNSLRQLGIKADIVFFGDSLTYYGDFAQLFPNSVVCNLGLRGDTIQGMIDRLEQVMILGPKVLYMMGGINDVGNKTVDEFESAYSKLVSSFLQGLKDVKLIIQSMLPVNSEDFRISCNNNEIKSCNLRIERIAKDNGLDFLDLYTLYEDDGQLPLAFTRDGIHLVPGAYEKWYNSIKK